MFFGDGQLSESDNADSWIRHAVSLSMVGFAMLVYGLMWWVLSQENQRRQDGKHDADVEGMSEEEIAELGDESPRFRYTT